MRRQQTAPFRSIPSIDAVLRREAIRLLLDTHGSALVTDAVREVIEGIRRDARGSGSVATIENLDHLVTEAVERRTTSTLRRVINATGVIVHTNLGRAVLSEKARERLASVATSYVTIEYDLERGERGSRSTHLERCLSALFPGYRSLAVNNNAAAVLLALNSLAEGREVILSRGEMVEIGGSFRIPEVLSKSGARLREVGTTNRTRLKDYEKAIGQETGLILKVHTSNYRIVGFTHEAALGDLVDLAGRHELPVMVDQGSGCLPDLGCTGIKDEPTVASILAQGADVVTFSGDKILGGPQAGIIVGRGELVEAMAANPLYRALRLDKLTVAALEATLEAYARGTEQEEIPVQRMIFTPRERLEERANRAATLLKTKLPAGFSVDTEEGVSRVGGGAAPMEDLPTLLVRLRPASESGLTVSAWENALRESTTPVIATVREDALYLDLRTVAELEEDRLIAAVVAATGGGSTDPT